MKKELLNKILILMMVILSFIIIQSCEEDIDEDLLANKTLISVMKEWYLWYDQLPTVSASDYNNPEELMEVLRVNPPDRWSYITTKQELDAYYNSGAYYGFGFGNGFDEDGKLWILYVFKNSPLAQNGITRGWRIEKINGVIPTEQNLGDLIGPNEAGISKTFDFIDLSGNQVTYTYTKISISMNTVLFDSTYTFGQSKVGYLVLKGFIEPTENELATSFAKFKDNGVNELIIDLRYNGGGLISVSQYLASLIGGANTTGQVFATYFHNNKKTSQNESIYFAMLANTLSLNRVVFITTEGTASASELVINGLKPFITVGLVGSTTHGKPAGMYSFRYNEFDWAFVPICFTLRNANNEGDYYDGILVDLEAGDDYSKKFGNIEEDSFNTALTYLGITTIKSKTYSPVKQTKVATGKGLYEEIGAW